MAKHYIKINTVNDITDAFSNKFQEPDQDSVFIKNGSRHFNLDLQTEEGFYKYKYENDEIIEKIHDEIYNYENLRRIKKREIIDNINLVAQEMGLLIDDIPRTIIREGVINENDFSDEVATRMHQIEALRLELSEYDDVEPAKTNSSEQ